MSFSRTDDLTINKTMEFLFENHCQPLQTCRQAPI